MKLSRYPAVFVPVLLAVLLLAACGSSGSQAADTAIVKPTTDRQTAPDFELKDMSGATVQLSDYHGQVVLLNFWATWCGPCKVEIPWFIEFEKKHKDDGFSVLGVSLDEGGWDAVKSYVDRSDVNYRVLLGTDEVAMLYGGVDSLPTTFLIDRDGKIASVHIGLVSKSEYESDIEALLGQKTTAVRLPRVDDGAGAAAGGR